MSLRKGVTTMEENKIRRAIAAGKTYREISEELEDVDHEYVRKAIYEPLKAAHEKANKK